MTKPVIGFIGVGLMGHGMAKNILEGGYSLVIKGNRNRVPVDDLVARGATEVATPREMAAACDIIHICLSNSPQVESVMQGEDGILAGMKPGLIVIDATTADPVSTMKLAAELKAKGGAMVDAPLGRTPKEAESGELDVMVGCDDENWDDVRPLIECWGGNINRIGPVGSGHKMKLIMNFISMGYASLYAEATVLAAKVGVSPQNVQQVIGTSRLGNGFFDTFMKYTVDRDRDAHKFAIANANKDVRYVNNMANDAGVMNVMASAVKHYFTHIEAAGHGGDYVPMISDHIARLNGMDMAEEVKKGA
ncbi:NAD(P)-dependent oxidoreductase [Marinovum sp. 2_MG-2023]|uniref:NAD(P)-dependent oxidoreductase n=1 Tax=unclassified Marinovum TaxID=2647166 RepID=UPI0026E19EEA|nr:MULTISPECIES: NAD(P)-dependent oxidoreductase [unclassified Marinovum]MDO6732776.1 NAD(P)-dependent oxidoreductase [Marinovum sp. 2_MG-2023]MDO6781884.1 NAD(P)-dependent oxidoreductase [Marinovum sp. 1_MG-2023]